MIAAAKIEAARELQGIKQTELAKKEEGISISTLNNIERGAQTDPKMSTITSLQQALAKADIEFTNDAFVEYRPDCIILDFMMYGADGFQLPAALRREPAKLSPSFRGRHA